MEHGIEDGIFPQTAGFGEQSSFLDEIHAARLDHPDAFVRQAAVDALGKQSSLPEEIFKGIAARLENLDTSFRQKAVDVLGTQPRLLDNILRDVAARLEDPLSSVRQAAINALYKKTSWPDEIFKSVASRLGHTDWFVRQAAIRDLEGTIQAVRQAVESTPADHPDRAGRLSNLGIMLFSRLSADRRDKGPRRGEPDGRTSCRVDARRPPRVEQPRKHNFQPVRKNR